MHSFFIVELSHRQLPQSIQNCEWMRRIAGKVKIYLMRFKERTVDGIGVGIQASANGIKENRKRFIRDFFLASK